MGTIEVVQNGWCHAFSYFSLQKYNSINMHCLYHIKQQATKRAPCFMKVIDPIMYLAISSSMLVFCVVHVPKEPAFHGGSSSIN